MEFKEIRDVMGKMDVATSRGRAEKNHREIQMRPDLGQIEMATKARIDFYIAMHRDIAEQMPHMRAGMTEDELEKLEFIREQLFDLAKDVSIAMIYVATEARR